ncbi:YggT family protein [Rubrobacter calidifluminis]|uniref:YggT family protein n=1 Tax=Rubrobacter calidifluminis TaxID=1392640 RepID=UPI00235F384E|nr:YggT family protein [Rubrobacter calidifluminis]
MALLLQSFGFSVARLLAGVVVYFYYILFAFILINVLLSWFPGYPSNSFLQALYDIVGSVVRPILSPIRRAIPALQFGGIALDLSPIIALIGLSIARSLLLSIIANFIRPVTG